MSEIFYFLKVKILIVIFWAVTSRIFVGGYQRFRGMCLSIFRVKIINGGDVDALTYRGNWKIRREKSERDG